MIVAALFSAIAASFLSVVLMRLFGPDGIMRKERLILERLRGTEDFSGQNVDTSNLVKQTHLSNSESFTQILKRYNFAYSIASSLKTLQWKISVSAFLSICFTLATFVFFGLWKIHIPLLGVLLGSALAGYAPYLYLKSMHERYRQKFSDHLPDTLSIIAGSIKVGHGIEAAIGMVTKTAPAPVCDEFRTVQAEMKLGLTLGASLTNLYKRIESPDLKIFITGLSVQQEMGGNLGEMLDNLERTIRQRFALQREVKALSAQGVYSARLLFAVTIGMMFFLVKQNPKMMMDFVSSPAGRVIAFLAVLCELVGFFWISRIIKIKS